MRYDPDIHHRRSIRLSGYDYSEPGFYFVTICTYGRELTLAGDDVVGVVHETWLSLPGRFRHVELDEFVVMPNHVHGIVVQTAASGVKLGKVLRAFKSISAISVNRVLGRTERPFWQRDYYERIIRSEAELEAVRQYVRDNPLDWDVDLENPES